MHRWTSKGSRGHRLGYTEQPKGSAVVPWLFKFIEGFPHHAHPLFNLTKKGESWKWGEGEQLAFVKLKELITLAPVVSFPEDSQMY